MNQINPAYAVPTLFIKILFILLVFHLNPDLPGGHFPSYCRTKSYVSHTFNMPRHSNSPWFHHPKDSITE